jgi:hypothetical protein
LSFLVKERKYDGQLYNVVTLNASVAEMVRIISLHVSDLRVQLVDSPVMNQLSYQVANKRFSDLGFTFNGDLNQGIAETVALFKAIGVGRSTAPLLTVSANNLVP